MDTSGNDEYDFFRCDACQKLVSAIACENHPRKGVAPYRICGPCLDQLERNIENITRGLRELGKSADDINDRLAKMTREFLHQPTPKEN